MRLQRSYEKPTPIQAQAIPSSFLEGKRFTRELHKTGTGKTTAFAIRFLPKFIT